MYSIPPQSHIDSATNIYARLYRGTDLNYGGKYLNAYVGDMFTKDRFTFNVGADVLVPMGHGMHTRSLIALRSIATYSPTGQSTTHGWQAVAPGLAA